MSKIQIKHSRSITTPCSRGTQVGMQSRTQTAGHFSRTTEASGDNWRSAAGKSFSKAFIDALRPRQLRERVKNEFITEDTAIQSPTTSSHHVLHLATTWPEIQRVVDAAINDGYGRGRGGRGRAGWDGRDRRDLYPRQGVNQTPASRGNIPVSACPRSARATGRSARSPGRESLQIRSVPERDTSSHNVGGNTLICAPCNNRRVRMTFAAKDGRQTTDLRPELA